MLDLIDADSDNDDDGLSDDINDIPDKSVPAPHQSTDPTRVTEQTAPTSYSGSPARLNSP